MFRGDPDRQKCTVDNDYDCHKPMLKDDQSGTESFRGTVASGYVSEVIHSDQPKSQFEFGPCILESSIWRLGGRADELAG